jgi:hypothetical protein
MTASPPEPKCRSEPGERSEQLGLAGERNGAPALAEARRVERRDERHLKRDVEADGDDHPADDRQRNVPARVAALAAELDGLLETEAREDHTAGRKRKEHALPPERHEAPAGAEVLAVGRGHEEGDDRQGRNEELPADGEFVRLRKPAHAHDVDRAEEQEQRRRDNVALCRQHRPTSGDSRQ